MSNEVKSTQYIGGKIEKVNIINNMPVQDGSISNGGITGGDYTEFKNAASRSVGNAAAVGELKQDIIDFKDNLYIYDKMESTISEHGYTGGEVGQNITISTSEYFRYLTADVSHMETVKVTYFSEGWLYNAIFTDSDDIIIGKYLYRETSTTKEQKKDIVLNVPHGATKLYLNSVTYGELYIKGKVLKKSNWQGKKCVCLGDSITEQGTWLPYLKNELGFSDVVNRGIGGSTVGSTFANAFWQDVRVNSIDIDADCIIIMGGTNDAGSAIPLSINITKESHSDTTTIGGFNRLLSKIFYKFYKLDSGFYSDVDYSGVTQVEMAKDITVLLVTPTYTNDPLFIGSDTDDRLKKIVDVIPNIAGFWNIPYCDNYYDSGINDQNLTYYLKQEEYNGQTICVHPNELGGKKIASAIIGALKKIQPVD